MPQIKLHPYILTILFCSVCSFLQARHLLGGYMSYECLGGGDYKIRMKLYRDCNCTNCAVFDFSAFFAIYNCEWESCPNLDVEEPFASFQAGLTTVRPVELPAAICQDISNNKMCIEEGLYEFKLSDLGINLPSSEQDYYIVYQRCCRSETVTDIVAPDKTGMTLFVKISPAAYASCNNSISLDVPPMFASCVQKAIRFPLSINNEDGDSLAVSFCAPYAGGGPLLDPQTFRSCEGAQPEPPCPPPYNEVLYRLPKPAGNFMEFDLDLKLDSSVIEISGLPEMLGQYTIGLCIQEFKDEELVAETSIQYETLILTAETTSHEELSFANDLRLYPNPNSSGELWLELPKLEETALFQLYTIDGKLVLEKTIQNMREKVNIQALSNGAYYCKIKLGRYQLSRKIFLVQ